MFFQDPTWTFSGRRYLWKSVQNYLSHGEAKVVIFFFFFIRNTLKKVHFSGLLLVGDVYDDVIFSGYNHFNVELTVLGAITPEDMNPF